jgi:hypothetical protein
MCISIKTPSPVNCIDIRVCPLCGQQMRASFLYDTEPSSPLLITVILGRHCSRPLTCVTISTASAHWSTGTEPGVTWGWSPSRDKLNMSHWTPWRYLGERKYSSYSFLTSALNGDVWSESRPGRALPPGTGPPVPIGQEAGWAPEPVRTQRLEEKSFVCAGNRTWIARSSSP